MKVISFVFVLLVLLVLGDPAKAGGYAMVNGRVLFVPHAAVNAAPCHNAAPRFFVAPKRNVIQFNAGYGGAIIEERTVERRGLFGRVQRRTVTRSIR